MVSFKAGTAIAFNSEGRVVKGTWAQDTVWRTENASPIPHIFFQAGTPATFNAQGTVVTGTLARETFLFNTAGIQKLYPKGSFVTFNSKGQVQ
jgi:hypothetical protein